MFAVTWAAEYAVLTAFRYLKEQLSSATYHSCSNENTTTNNNNRIVIRSKPTPLNQQIIYHLEDPNKRYPLPRTPKETYQDIPLEDCEVYEGEGNEDEIVLVDSNYIEWNFDSAYNSCDEDFFEINENIPSRTASAAYAGTLMYPQGM